MAYVLGFFAADGYITVNKRGGQYWGMDIGDKNLLEKIKAIIQSEHKISLRNRQGGRYQTYRLQIGSAQMCDDLRGLDFDERKTKRLLFPEVPDQYLGHFVRGYFDGDGNVWSGVMHKSRKTSTLTIQTVFTSCSHVFLQQMRKKLEALGIERGVLSRCKGNYYRLVYSVLNSLKLYDFMYNQPYALRNQLFLIRKKEVFEKYQKLKMRL